VPVSRVVNLTRDFQQRVTPFQNEALSYNAPMISEQESPQSDMIDMTPHNAGHPERPPEEVTMLALFRLLMKDPGANHDFHTCATCKRYGITEI
jgi:hypothetical protein